MTGATQGVIGVCIGNCVAGQQAKIQTFGDVACQFDNTKTIIARDYAQVSNATNGQCVDAGPSYPSSGGEVLGLIRTSGNPGTLQTVTLFGADVASNATQQIALAPLSNTAISSSCATTQLQPALNVANSTDMLVLLFGSSSCSTTVSNGNPCTTGLPDNLTFTINASPGITDNNGGTWVKAVSAGSNTTLGRSEIWYSLKHPVGKTTVTVPLTTGGSHTCEVGAGLYEFSNVLAIGALDASGNNVVTTGNPNTVTAASTALTTTQASDLIISTASIYNNSGTATQGTNSIGGIQAGLNVAATELVDPQPGGNLFNVPTYTNSTNIDAYYLSNVTGTQNIAWGLSATTSAYYSTIAAFKLTAPAPGTVLPISTSVQNSLAGFAVTGNTQDFKPCSTTTGNLTSTVMLPSAGGTGSGGLNAGQHPDIEPASSMEGVFWFLSAQINNITGTTAAVVPSGDLCVTGFSACSDLRPTQDWQTPLSPTSMPYTVAAGSSGGMYLQGFAIAHGTPSLPTLLGAGKILFSSADTTNCKVNVNLGAIVMPVRYGFNPSNIANGANFGIGGMLE